MRALALLFAWFALFAASGCGRIAGLGEYEVGGTEAAWACLDQPRAPAGPGPFDITVEVQPYLNSGSPFDGAEVTLCRLNDPGCLNPESPVGTATGADGIVKLRVRREFPGFIRIKAGEAGPMDRFVPTFYYLNPFINDHQTIRVPLATFQLQETLTTSLNNTQRPEFGLLLLNALTCQNQGAAGIDFESEGSDELTTKWFVVEGAPNASATVTEAAGYGGFINVKPGTFAVRAKLGERTIDTVSVTVRPGAITQTRFVPSGRPPLLAPAATPVSPPDELADGASSSQ
jgi:hypothetical protein